MYIERVLQLFPSESNYIEGNNIVSFQHLIARDLITICAMDN